MLNLGGQKKPSEKIKYVNSVLEFRLSIKWRVAKAAAVCSEKFHIYVCLQTGLLKDKLISKPAPTHTDFQFVSHQHLNFEIEILLERDY